MTRLKRKLPPVVLARSIFCCIVLGVLLVLSLGSAVEIGVWLAFALLVGFPYLLANLITDLGYQIEYDGAVIRQRNRGIAWLLGRQGWVQTPLASIHTVNRLEPSQSMYRESGARPIELVGHDGGQTRIIRVEPIAFDDAALDNLLCAVEGLTQSSV